MGFAMQRLLIRNIKTLVSCDEQDTVYENVDLYAEDGVIRAIGPALEKQADEILDASHMLCYPGLVNTHHHLYQQFSRNLPQVQNMELFDWLKTLYEIWKNLDAEVIRLSSLTGMGELMKHGCTTCFDHHYVFPAGCGDLIGAQFAAAEELGMRMFASRGSMDLSRKDGGLPPDSVVQTVDAIMKDSARVIEAYHDPSFGSMRQVALAPCSPFSVSGELLRQSAILARQYGVRLHTHLCETRDEEHYTLEHYGVRPLEYMASLGWTGPDVWYAHGIHFNDEELRELARTGTGVEMYDSYSEYVDAEDGCDLTLTIDTTIQSYAERILEEGIKAYDVQRGGWCVVLDPQTGAVLAMASSPEFDPNSYSAVTDSLLQELSLIHI